jgi:hypothetical protein
MAFLAYVRNIAVGDPKPTAQLFHDEELAKHLIKDKHLVLASRHALKEGEETLPINELVKRYPLTIE